MLVLGKSYDANATRSVLEACANECGRHAEMHGRCKVLAEAYRRWEKAFRR